MKLMLRVDDSLNLWAFIAFKFRTNRQSRFDRHVLDNYLLESLLVNTLTVPLAFIGSNYCLVVWF